jgi:hypothetical protein
MRLIIIFLLISLSSFSDSPKLVKNKVGTDITWSIPADFIAMTPEDIIQRVPSVRAPLAAFSNLERDMELTVTTSATQWPDQNLAVAQSFFRSGFRNLFDRVEILKEEIKEINGKKFIVFEIETRMNGNKNNESQKQPILKYTYIQYLVQKDRTLVFSFICPARVKTDWQPVAAAVMNSVRVK